jgi:adenylate cyclase
VLRVRLSAQGYEVVTAIDGEEGLQRARELEPDLVLLDVMMPKLDYRIEIASRRERRSLIAMG